MADVKVSAVIPAPRERVAEWLTDLQHLRAVIPTTCIEEWEMGSATQGLGASAAVVYNIHAMHRRLTMAISRVDPGTLIDFDHAGAKGFVNRWTFEDAEGGTKVTVLTPLNPPPWPFQGVYFRYIKPDWEECYRRAIDGVAASVK